MHRLVHRDVLITMMMMKRLYIRRRIIELLWVGCGSTREESSSELNLKTHYLWFFHGNAR